MSLRGLRAAVLVIAVCAGAVAGVASPAGAAISVHNYTGTGINHPSGITPGPDGALWFTSPGNSSIDRITTTGQVTSYTDPSISNPFEITAGPDGALWFPNFAIDGSIGRITTTGQVTSYTDPSLSSPYGITSGPDGALWFTNQQDGSIGRITTTGQVTNYTDPSISSPYVIIAGPDGALWFTNYGNNSIGRITTSSPVIHGVTFTGDTASPTVIITGQGFGAIPPAGMSDNSTGCGTYTHNGKDYGTSNLWFEDVGNFSAGSGTPPNGDCVGLIVKSWSTGQVVYQFGNAYDTFAHWYITAGDQYTISVRNAHYSGTVSFSG
jgi:streptogramin lyase